MSVRYRIGILGLAFISRHGIFRFDPGWRGRAAEAWYQWVLGPLGGS